jgi:hypothetical protein
MNSRRFISDMGVSSPAAELYHEPTSGFLGADLNPLGLADLLLCCRPNDTQVLKVHRAAGFQSRLSEVGLMNVAAVSAHTAPGSANNLFGNGLFKPGFGLNG